MKKQNRLFSTALSTAMISALACTSAAQAGPISTLKDRELENAKKEIARIQGTKQYKSLFDKGRTLDKQRTALDAGTDIRCETTDVSSNNKGYTGAKVTMDTLLSGSKCSLKIYGEKLESIGMEPDTLNIRLKYAGAEDNEAAKLMSSCADVAKVAGINNLPFRMTIQAGLARGALVNSYVDRLNAAVKDWQDRSLKAKKADDQIYKRLDQIVSAPTAPKEIVLDLAGKVLAKCGYEERE